MGAQLEIGAVFAGPEMEGVGDPFGRRQNMNLDLHLLIRSHGRKAAIFVSGSERELRDALGEREGMFKTAGAAAQVSLRVQRDKGPAPLPERGLGRHAGESLRSGAAKREAGGGQQGSPIGSVELVGGGRKVTHGAVADRMLVVSRDGAGRVVIEGFLKRLAGESAQGFEQQLNRSCPADGGAGAAQFVTEESRVQATGGGKHGAIEGAQSLRGRPVAGERKVLETAPIVGQAGAAGKRW